MLVFFAFFVAVFSHLCLYTPPQRAAVLTPEQYLNTSNPALNICKRNVNIEPFENAESSITGNVCGGSYVVPQANTPFSSEDPRVAGSNGVSIYTLGDTISIETLINRAHPSLNGGRSTYVLFDYAKTSNPTSNSEFIPIIIVGTDHTNNQRIEIDWTPTEEFSGVLRAIYFTAVDITSPFPNFNGTGIVSNTYTACSDIEVTGGGSRSSSMASFLRSLF